MQGRGLPQRPQKDQLDLAFWISVRFDRSVVLGNPGMHLCLAFPNKSSGESIYIDPRAHFYHRLDVRRRTNPPTWPRRVRGSNEGDRLAIRLFGDHELRVNTIDVAALRIVWVAQISDVI